METSATELVTFVTISHPDMIVVVHNVHNRLVVMLPNTAHKLKVSRFYIILAGSTDTSYGIVYFRQDQPHIDLFVFFSVFFSCFFLFLAACVMLWKAKQAVDRQRTRHRRQIEMQDMASRPFASVLVYMPHTAADYQRLEPPPPSDRFRLSPVAVEPTRTAGAVVATFMFELPCSTVAPVRACLGSCLLTPRTLNTSTSCHYVPVKQTSSLQPRSSVT